MSRSGFHNALTNEEPPEIDLPLDMAFVDGAFERIEQVRPDSHRFISRRQRGSFEDDERWTMSTWEFEPMDDASVCDECGFVDGEHSNACLGVD